MNSILTQKKCVACESGMPPLTPEQLEEFQRQLKSPWNVKENKVIERRFKFKTFAEALKFVNKVGEIAEGEGHHPDISFGWGYAIISLTTHNIGGLSENDFILAAKIDEIV